MTNTTSFTTTSTNDLEARRLPAKVAACRLDSLESQAVFKVMLDTLARPGSIRTLPSAIVARFPSVLAPIVVLADVETGVHVADTETFVWGEAVTSATGARSTSVAEADLVAIPIDAVDRVDSIIELTRSGSAFSPESGARVVIAVHDIRSRGIGARSGVNLVLTGPGVDGESVICVDGLTESAITTWRRINSRFPAGVDVWLVTDDGRTIGVPRSTHIEIVATWPTQERNQ